MRWMPAACLIASLALGACGESEPAPPTDAPPAAADAARAGSRAAPAPSGLEEGEFVVSVVGGRVRLASRGAPRLDVLRRLADLEAFTLEANRLPPRELTLLLEDASLATAVSELLDDVSYHAAYEFDPRLGRNRLASLRVGDAAAAPGRWIPARPAEAPGLPAPTFAPGAGSGELDEEQRRWLENLASPDDRERLEAAREVDSDGPGLARLVELARSDPDPQVRATAVERLEDSGTHAAVEGMLAALGDDDPRVVLAAISGLEYAGDETVVPRLRPLLEHDSREVRDAAREAIEFLE